MIALLPGSRPRGVPRPISRDQQLAALDGLADFDEPEDGVAWLIDRVCRGYLLEVSPTVPDRADNGLSTNYDAAIYQRPSLTSGRPPPPRKNEEAYQSARKLVRRQARLDLQARMAAIQAAAEAERAERWRKVEAEKAKQAAILAARQSFPYEEQLEIIRRLWPSAIAESGGHGVRSPADGQLYTNPDAYAAHLAANKLMVYVP